MKIKISKKDFEKLSKAEPNLSVEQQDSDEKNKLKNQIEEIEKEYQNSPAWTYDGIAIPKGEEKVFEMPSESDITDMAKKQISPEYDVKRQDTTLKNQVEKENLKKSSDEVYKRAEESISTLKNNYEKAKENASNQAVKRGLERSSIILEQLKDLDLGESISIADVLTGRDASLSEVDSKIYNLDKSLENAINLLNEQEAKEVAKKVEGIVKDYEKQKSEVDDYNNKLNERIASLKTQLRSAGIDPSEENSDEYKKMYTDKLKAFYSYYYSLGSGAQSELDSDKDYLIEHLGADGYQTLKNYLK